MFVRTVASKAFQRRVVVRRRRIEQVSLRRRYATESTSSHSQTSPSRTGAYYKTFGSPVLKCFLGALFTYQVVYYAWLKLEAMEQVGDKSAQVAHLQQELRNAVREQKQRPAPHAAVDGTKGKEMMEEAKEEEEAVKATSAITKVAKGGWWPG